MSVTFGNWEMQAGDPADFAFRLAFLPNPHGNDDRAIPEERVPRGAFSVWAHGENLCAHVEQGEISTGAEPIPGMPDQFRFLYPNRAYRVDPVPAAEALFGVLSAAAAELKRRLPRSPRTGHLCARIACLTLPGRGTSERHGPDLKP